MSSGKKAWMKTWRGFPMLMANLFQGRLGFPAFNASMRSLLIEACEFSWDAISPAIFGSLFQSVMNPRERRSQGAHYTTEKNILKVIEPLFLDELRAEFTRLTRRRDTGRRKALEAFHQRLSTLRFFESGLWLRQLPDYLLPRTPAPRNRPAESAAKRHPIGPRCGSLVPDRCRPVLWHRAWRVSCTDCRSRRLVMDHIMNNGSRWSLGRATPVFPSKNPRTSCMPTRSKLTGQISSLQMSAHTFSAIRHLQDQSTKALNRERKSAA